jgi:hypothetical protein
MRAAIGLLALVLLVLGVVARNQADSTLSAASGASMRVGVIMAVWWFAYPQLKNVPTWLAVACAITLFFVMRWPKLLLVAIPLLAVLWFLGPRTSRGSGG